MSNGGGWKTGEGGTGTAAERVSGWLDRVPGYRGYRAKEDRRDADRRVRDTLSAELGARAARVEAVARTLANERRLSEIGPVDELARTIRHLADRVRTASYGYGGLFSDRDVDEAALDQLRRFDESLLAGVADLDRPVAALEQALASGGDLSAAARSATEQAKQTHARLDLRGRVIESGEAAPKERVEALLTLPAAVSVPPPAFNLAYGDAIAILGDNFVVDARIDLASQDTALRLFRLGTGEPERWLLVPHDPTLGHANLEATEAQPPGTGQTTVAGEGFRELATGSGEGELSTGERASGRRAVAFRLLVGTDDPARRALILDWGDDQRVYVGKEVHPADIEIFGRATS